MEAEAAETARSDAQKRLAEYEEAHQPYTPTAKTSAASKKTPCLGDSSETPVTKKETATGDKKRTERMEELKKQLEELQNEGSEDEIQLINSETEEHGAKDDIERPVEPGSEVDGGLKGKQQRKRKQKTATDSESNVTPSTLPQKRPGGPGVTKSDPKKTKKPKANTRTPLTGLKKDKTKKKTQNVEVSNDSMLQEGQSCGFDDNKEADAAEQRSILDAKIKVPVKIQNKPLQLLVGKAARKPGEPKFTAKHLPDFMQENNGYRAVLSPLSKEAVGHVHSWVALKPSMVQSIVDRGWGPGRVVVAT
ncbi:hypothetical protein V5O48_017160, partial [Marasmius crinis-equi]